MRVAVARRAFRLGGGRSHTYRVALNARGRPLLRASGRLEAQLLVAIPGSRATRTVELSGAPSGQRRRGGAAALEAHGAHSCFAAAYKRGDRLDDRGGGLGGGAGVKGRLGVVLDPQLDRLGDLRPGLQADQVERHVDPGRDPAAVIVLPSCTKRPPTGSAPSSRSCSRKSQWQVARLPSSSPAAPSTSEPVQTEVVHLVS